MRYEHINAVCKCGDAATHIWKGVITERMVLRREDTICLRCLKQRIVLQCTGYDEWLPLTTELYNKRNNE